MSRFPSEGHLISWAGMCPRNDESAGKRRSNRLRKGAPWLKTTLVQCAWAAVRNSLVKRAEKAERPRLSVSQMLARIRQHIVAVDTRGGNRMRESCTYGSVRGVRGNSHPYRADCSLPSLLHCMSPVMAVRPEGANHHAGKQST
jgi:hypothetical protein